MPQTYRALDAWSEFEWGRSRLDSWSTLPLSLSLNPNYHPLALRVIIAPGFPENTPVSSRFYYLLFHFDISSCFTLEYCRILQNTAEYSSNPCPCPAALFLLAIQLCLATSPKVISSTPSHCTAQCTAARFRITLMYLLCIISKSLFIYSC